jgi:GNAT superfamily N-acetyltransferase
MASIHDVAFRAATSAAVAAMARCRLADPAAGLADPRMEAYFNGQHHPQQALLPRAGYVALTGDQVIGYIAGHRTNRHGCEGEVQYLFVAPAYRRRGIATALLRLLAAWFHAESAKRVCVAVADDSPPEAKPFFESVGATPLKKHWYGWEDIAAVLRSTIAP